MLTLNLFGFFSSRLEEVDDIFIAIMEQMSKIPAAVKSWKNPAVDVFNDNKLFAATPGSGLKWRSIIKTLIDTDKTALSELLGELLVAFYYCILIEGQVKLLQRPPLQIYFLAENTNYR